MENYRKIDLQNWERKPYFDNFFHQMKCTYSITVNIDITGLMAYRNARKTRLYPLLIYILSKAVNRHEEFRTAFNSDNEIIIWERLHPCYTIFHKDTGTFSNMWTEWNEDLEMFLESYGRDMVLYGKNHGIEAKPGTPANVFPVSVLPWTTFTGFNLNIESDGKYLLPIFTYGKYFEQEKRLYVPLSVQVHHAVCDGFHVSGFIEELRQICQEFHV